MPEDKPFVIEQLIPDHDRSRFSCGHESLDRFIREFASQNARSGVSQTFVAVRQGERIVRGYYALSAGNVELTHIPEGARKRLPRSPVPVIHLGRLAVDASARGERLGELLLFDALARALQVAKAIGVHAVEVVAIDVAAAGFYRKYGFTDLYDARHLYLPIEALRKAGL